MYVEQSAQRPVDPVVQDIMAKNAPKPINRGIAIFATFSIPALRPRERIYTFMDSVIKKANSAQTGKFIPEPKST